MRYALYPPLLASFGIAIALSAAALLACRLKISSDPMHSQLASQQSLVGSRQAESGGSEGVFPTALKTQVNKSEIKYSLCRRDDLPSPSPKKMLAGD